VLVVLSDTHRESGTGFPDAVGTAVADAERVVHAGDFTTPAALDAVTAAAPRLDAVHGNADDPAVRERLPAERTLTHGGVRIAVTHRRDGGPTGLAMFGRSRGAALVVSGHTHRPAVVEGEPTLLNPGSYAAPRGNRAAYATLEPTADGLAGAVRTVDGEPFERFAVERGERS